MSKSKKVDLQMFAARLDYDIDNKNRAILKRYFFGFISLTILVVIGIKAPAIWAEGASNFTIACGFAAAFSIAVAIFCFYNAAGKSNKRQCLRRTRNLAKEFDHHESGMELMAGIIISILDLEYQDSYLDTLITNLQWIMPGRILYTYLLTAGAYMDVTKIKGGGEELLSEAETMVLQETADGTYFWIMKKLLEKNGIVNHDSK